MQARIYAAMLVALFGTALQPAFADSTTTNQNNFIQSFNPKNATIIVQAGGFNATQGGESQYISINGLVGDQFTVNQTHGSNFLGGLGYYLNAHTTSKVQWLCGINAFYFAPTTVSGDVYQEAQASPNLSYQYNITNYPIYLATKAIIHINKTYNVTVDLGVGPNIITTNNFTESSLDGDVTQPDNIFRGATSVAFSATAGLGIQFQHVLGSLPLEIGYRFFYLGQGQLNSQTDQVLNNLKTGNNYANALIVSTSF